MLPAGVHGELSEGLATIGAAGEVVQCGQGPDAVRLVATI
jgi:hypothetical protein